MSDPITVCVAEVKGSAPREPGAMMYVWPDRQEGTIGGGALEWEAARIARKMLETGKTEMQRNMPLGPELGQCCGGVVVLNFKLGRRALKKQNQSLWIWGAGHVGHAIAEVMAPLNRFEVMLADTSQERMPRLLNEAINPLVASDPARLVGHAPKDAVHVILTYSHDLDFKLCDALLQHGFGQAGLIGSKTKWARFRKRLAALGHDAAAIERIICPIGDPAWGKDPQAIAVSVAAALLSRGVLSMTSGDTTL